MKLQDESKKFADLSEEIRKRSVKIEELKEQNRAYEKGNNELESMKSILLEEMKVLEGEKKSLLESKIKLEKEVKIDQEALKESGVRLNETRTENAKLLGEVQELQTAKALLLVENNDLSVENESVSKEIAEKLTVMKEFEKGLNELKEQLDIKEMLLNNREKKLDLREQALG